MTYDVYVVVIEGTSDALEALAAVTESLTLVGDDLTFHDAEECMKYAEANTEVFR